MFGTAGHKRIQRILRGISMDVQKMLSRFFRGWGDAFSMRTINLTTHRRTALWRPKFFEEPEAFSLNSHRPAFVLL